MACVTRILSKSTLLCTAAALGLASGLPAHADGPCMPRFADREHLLFVETPAYAEKLEVGDIDGDGWLDVFVAREIWQTPDAYAPSILLNDPDTGLRDATREMFEGAIPKTINPAKVLLKDFNGDGRVDVFIADSGQDGPVFPMAQNQLYLSTPEGKLHDATDRLPRRLDYTHSAHAADIDGDGDLEILPGDMWSTPPHFLINDGTGNFTADFDRIPRHYVNDPEKQSYTAVHLADLDGDAAPDLVLGDGSYYCGHTPSYVFLNDGRGMFTPVDTPLPPSAFSPENTETGFDVAAGFAADDIDGDGVMDLLAQYTNGEWEPRDLQVLIGNGDGTFRDETDARLRQNHNALWMKWMTFVDMNSDGVLDFVGWPVAGSIPLYLNDGEGQLVWEYFPMFISEFAILDVDRDGKLDVLGVWVSSGEGGAEDYGYHRSLGCDQSAATAERAGVAAKPIVSVARHLRPRMLSRSAAKGRPTRPHTAGACIRSAGGRLSRRDRRQSTARRPGFVHPPPVAREVRARSIS